MLYYLLACNCAINRYASVYQSMTLTAVCHFMQAMCREGGREGWKVATAPRAPAWDLKVPR